MEYDRKVLVNVLVHHRPTQYSACMCGGVQLGYSWPEHIANVYEEEVKKAHG